MSQKMAQMVADLIERGADDYSNFLDPKYTILKARRERKEKLRAEIKRLQNIKTANIAAYLEHDNSRVDDSDSIFNAKGATVIEHTQNIAMIKFAQEFGLIDEE